MGNSRRGEEKLRMNIYEGGKLKRNTEEERKTKEEY